MKKNFQTPRPHHGTTPARYPVRLCAELTNFVHKKKLGTTSVLKLKNIVQPLYWTHK